MGVMGIETMGVAHCLDTHHSHDLIIALALDLAQSFAENR